MKVRKQITEQGIVQQQIGRCCGSVSQVKSPSQETEVVMAHNSCCGPTPKTTEVSYPSLGGGCCG